MVMDDHHEDTMFAKRDSYRKLHRRRRRRRRSKPTSLIAAILLIGTCAALVARYKPEPGALALSTQKRDVVAYLTAQDATRNAVTIAGFVSDEEAAPAEATPPPPKPTHWAAGRAVELQGELRKDESISIALSRRHVPSASLHAALAALQGVVNFRRSKPGDPWEVDVDTDGAVTRLRYAAGPLNVWEAIRGEKGYVSKKVDVTSEKRIEVVSGTINASLWQAFERAGADGRLAAGLADIFAYTIDFATETQRGDKFYVAFESTWHDGSRVQIGRIVAARYVGKIGDHHAYRWNDAYYDASGESVERQFLRSPLRTTRITSSYGRRFHPVLGKMKMHAGVDYGAPTGTPVQAVADGTVTFAGFKGANGKLVALRHAGGYTTYYAHLSHIGSGVRTGVRVKKKQVIGKVGSTGRSTGPHLHFGMKRNGAYINPLEVDFERGTPLGSAERKKFLAATARLSQRLQ